MSAWHRAFSGVRFAALLALVAFVIVGCNVPGTEHEAPTFPAALAGTRDLALGYEVVGAHDRARPRFGEDLRALVLARLSAAQIAADVSESESGVRVVVDEAHEERVDELLAWTGTLVFSETDDAFELPPPPATSSGVARDPVRGRFEGSRASLVDAIGNWPVDAQHRILAEPPWVDGSASWHTRVVRATGAIEIADGALVGWGNGATLELRAAAGSAAELALTSATKPKTIAARGVISLGSPVAVEGGVGIAFGNGAVAYERAANERRLLTSPRLPSLHRTSETRLAPNRTLALACLVLPIALSVAWLAFVRRFDRAHPEPVWLVAVTFLLGALATIPAGLLELGLANLSPWLDPSLVTLGGRASALPVAIVVFTVVVGLSEEASKRLAAELAVRRREFDEPIDGIVYGIVASLGFAAAENVHYFALGRLSAPLVIGRSFMSIPAHMFFGALWGHALGRRLLDPKARTWPWLLAAATCHGLFDALLSTENAAIFAIALNVLLASVFVVLVRSSLRHGVVTAEMRAIRPEDRVLVPVGRPVLFWTSAALVHVLAFGIFMLGAYYQLARSRPTMLFVVGSSTLLGLLAVAALGVSTTMDLDVAIDAHGLTFAGAARSWRQIRGASVERGRVVVDCEDGPLLVGPGPADVLDAIASEIQLRLAGSGGAASTHC